MIRSRTDCIHPTSPSLSVQVGEPYLSAELAAQQQRALSDAAMWEILAECDDDPIGMVLWRAARAASLWIVTPTQLRPDLYDARSQAAEVVDYDGILGALTVINDLTSSPGGVTDAEVGDACNQVSYWAEFRGRPATAFVFARLTAFLRTGEAPLALRVGRLARDRADYGEAGAWFARGVRLARTNRDSAHVAMGYGSQGIMARDRGNLPRARRLLKAHLRIAARGDHRELMAMAHHDLMAVEVLALDFARVDTHARAALSCYGVGHAAIPRLSYDCAYALDLRGRPAEAMRILIALVPHFQRPRDQLLVWADLARVAGQLGESVLYERARIAVWDLVKAHRSEPTVARALLDLARGAERIGELRHARVAIDAALDTARARGEGLVAIKAEEQLDAILAAADHPSRSGATWISPSESSPESLVDSLVKALTAAVPC